MASTRDSKPSIEDAADEIGGAASRFTQRLRANGAVLQDDLREAGERLGEGAKQFSQAAAEQIRAHPLTAFGIAFVAGVALTRLLRR